VGGTCQDVGVLLPEPDRDEFADVPALATRLGVGNALRASRLTVPTRDGRSVSAVSWTAAAPDGAVDGAADGRVATTGSTVYLHGVGIDARSFDETILAAGRPAVAFDLPGHGRSAWRDDADYSATTAAPDLVAAMDTLRMPPGVLVGHSLGAIVAARIATTAPERVTGLVLVDMSPDFTQRAVDRIVRALEVEPDHDDLDAVVEHALATRLGEERAALEREARHATRVDGHGRRVRRHHFPHLSDGVAASIGRFADAWADLDTLSVPLLLVRGDRGYVSPKLEREFAARMPAATIVTVSSRHAVQTQAPRELAAAISTWRDAHGL
jgi:pimeloyl-ACP methyl ester carboxylesterase